MKKPLDRDLAFKADLRALAYERPRLSAHILLLTIVATLFGFLVWAGYAEIDEVTHGEGKIIPSSQVQVVQNLEGGIVAAILVAEGEAVSAGQPLIQLDATLSTSNFGEKQADFLGTLAKVARLEAEAAGKPLDFPPELVAQVDKELLGNERQIYDSHRQELSTNGQILRLQLSQRENELREIDGQIVSLERSLGLARQERAITAPNVEAGAAAKVDLIRIDKEISDLTGRLSASRTARPKVESAIAEARERLNQVEDSFRSKALTELKEARVHRTALTEELKSLRDRVRRTEVRAPTAGIISKLHVATVGGVVGAGAHLVEIVPAEDALQFEAKLPPADIAFIVNGQPAQIKLSAYDFATYGALPGEVHQVSADSFQDEQGQLFFKMIVRAKATHLGDAKRPLPISPGMTGTVDVMTGKKTVLQYLLKPLQRVRAQALTER